MPWSDLWSSSKKHDASSTESPLEEKLRSSIDSVLPSSSNNDTTSSTTFSLQSYQQPQTIVATVILTTLLLGSFRFYKTYLRRIPEAPDIKQTFFRKRSLFGKVTSVGDGDNFRLYHTPGGLLSGWHWLPGRTVPKDKKHLKNQTIHVRIAGVDAPELAHFGRPSQPFAQEALDWLTAYVNGRRVRAYVYRPDQYSRAVATVYVRKGLLRRDVGLQMIRAGFATVYEAKSGAEFGDEGTEQKYRKAEWWAKTKRLGMWSGKKADFESPREYKKRHGMGSPDDGAKS